MPSRPARHVATLLAATLALTACGAGSEKGTGGDGASGGSGGAFPVTVETAFGEVTVDKEPTRVVALGWSDAETALALGVQPVGASDWLGVGVGGDGLGDWVEDGYDEAPEISRRWSPATR
jgi:iron complex transport system substrate-binding protein